jgi:plasmid stabilization system protein ParE
VARLSFLDSAKADLVQILRYITTQSGSLTIGQEFVAELRQKCRNLADLPGLMGRPRPELRNDIRSFAFRGYVIFFRYIEDRFEVVNILEGHRDLDAFFEDNDRSE